MDSITEDLSSSQLSVSSVASLRQQIELHNKTKTGTSLAATVPKHELAVREALTFYNTLTSFSLPTETITLPNGEVKSVGLNDHLPELVNPVVAEDRNKAIQTINSLLLTIDKIKKDVQQEQEGPACPYEKTKIEYLGANFIVPSIHDLDVPKNFSVEIATKAIKQVSTNYNNVLMTNVQQMTAEAADTSYVGIKTEQLGNAFVVLSATSKGTEYVVDKHKAALHLEFAELVRNIPLNDILENPTLVAQKLITRYMQINFDVISKGDFTAEELSKQSLDFTS